jgi:hypothetical protein
LPQAAVQGTSMQIIGLTGQVVLEKPLEVGAVLQHMHAFDLPQGIYFLQIVYDGLVLSVDRFVKL